MYVDMDVDGYGCGCVYADNCICGTICGFNFLVFIFVDISLEIEGMGMGAGKDTKYM